MWHPFDINLVAQAYQDIYYVAESFDDVKAKLRWTFETWFLKDLHDNNRVWTASSLSRPFTVRYIPFSQTIEVLDTYCSTSNLITVSKIGVISVEKMKIVLFPGVEDAGEPAICSLPADFRKLNIGDSSPWRLFIQTPKESVFGQHNSWIEGRLILSEQTRYIVGLHKSVPWWSVIHKWENTYFHAHIVNIIVVNKVTLKLKS